MPTPSRDRLARPVDISALYRGAARRVDLIVDQPGLQWTGLSGGRVSRARAAQGRGRVAQWPWLVEQENRTPGRTARRGSRGRRGRGTRLPSWYPRSPLRDITDITRAIERRRAEINQTTEAPRDEANVEEAEPDQEIGSQTPLPTVSVKPQPSPATQLLFRIKPKTEEGLTPQKTLLNSIEKVREVWLEEKKKLDKTPASKKAEREKKVRVLMSMR